MTEMVLAARALRMRLSFLTANTGADIEAALTRAVEPWVEALIVSDKPFFTVRHDHIVAWVIQRSNAGATTSWPAD
jgi:hypothetical protein